jgi:hypothetical protein
VSDSRQRGYDEDYQTTNKRSKRHIRGHEYTYLASRENVAIENCSIASLKRNPSEVGI